jgi:hypothetical protein
MFCDHKGGKKEGSIFLKVATIKLIPEDPLRIVIETGTGEMQLRADSPRVRADWLKAIKACQERLRNEEREKQKYTSIEELARTSSPEFKKILISPALSMINEKLASVWATKAQMDKTLSDMRARVAPNNAPMFKLLEDMEKNSTELKVS